MMALSLSRWTGNGRSTYARRISVCAIWMVVLLLGTHVWGLDIAVAQGEPDIGISESDHDFGNVQMGQGAYWTLRVRNVGEGDLLLGYSITSEDGSFGFDPGRIPPESPTVSPGDSLELFVLFKPTSPGDHEGTLTLQSNDPDEAELVVTLTGRGVAPQIVLSETAHDFGDVLVDQASDYWMLRINNEGEGDLSILKLQIVPEETRFFFDELPTGEALTIAPGGALELSVFFAPTSTGLQEGKVTVRSNDPDTPELVVTLRGCGVAPDMVLSEPAHDFGDVLVGQGADWTLRITNKGDGVLSLGYSVTSEDGSFGFDPDRMPPTNPTLSPGDTLELFLRFAPTSPGAHEGRLTLQSNDPDEAELVVALTGGGVAPKIALSETAHDFGDVQVGQVGYWTLRIGNEGDGDLYLALTMTPDDVGFGWISSQLPPDWDWETSSISPGDTLELVLGFQPRDATLQTATLLIESNDPDAPESEVTLRGRGVQSRVALSAVAHDFGDVPVRQGADWTLTITNEGEGDLSILGKPQIVPEEAEFFFDEEGLPTDWTIAPDGALEVPLFFAPTSSGLQEGKVVIQTNDPDSPELVVTLTGRGVQSRIVLSESAHDFGDVPVGQIADWTLRIRNEGGSDLTLGYSITSDSGNFGWDPERMPPTSPTVSPGDSLELFLIFAATSPGTQEGRLVIESNDPDTPKVEVPLTGRGAQSRMTLSDSTHHFGDVQMGQGAYWVLRIGNEGESELSFGYAITSEDGSFGFDPDRMPPASPAVSPGDSLDLFLYFVPGSLGGHEATLTLRSNDPDHPEVTVHLEGTGVPVPQPAITVSASEHDFGEVQVGQITYWTLRIGNEGEADLLLGYSVTSGNGNFGFDPERMPPTDPAVSPGDTLGFVLGFAPGDATLQTGTLILETNDPDVPKLEISLRGTGIEPPRPDAQIVIEQESHDFGIVPVGQQSSYWSLRIMNGGEAELFISGLDIGPQDAGFSFDVTRLPEEWWTIAPADTLELFLFFAPSSSERQEGAVVIRSNDPDRGEVQVALFGNGPYMALGASEHDFGNVGFGYSGQWNVTIRNDGTAPLSVKEVSLKEGTEFSVEALALPQTIEAGGALNVAVVFTPSSMGATYLDTLVVTGDDPYQGTLEVRLSGTGVELQEPHIALEVSTYDFGEVDFGHSEPCTLTIGNDGTAPLSVEEMRLNTGKSYSLEEMSLPHTVEPGGALDVTVVFTPSSTGPIQDVLVVTSDDPNQGTLVVSLIGTGVLQMRVQQMDAPYSLPAETYRMISIPLALDNTSPQQVLEPILGAYDETQWRLFRYQAGGYVEYGAGFEPFAPGRAFWLITKGSVALYAGPGTSVLPNSPEGDYRITLQPGWNMIGVPFNFPVAWSQVDLGGKIVQPPVAYSGTAFQYNQKILEPWHGYAVKNLAPTAAEIRIPPVRAGKMSPSKTALPPGGWTMDIRAHCGRFEDAENTVGWLPDAQEAWDTHELSEAPSVGGFTALYFDHGDWVRYPGRYTTDFRPVGLKDYVWDFVVETNIPSEEVTLRWGASLPPGRKGYLIDSARNVRVDLTKQKEYRFFSEASWTHRAFRLIVGTPEFAARESSEASARPDAFRLAQNVPNPFNPRTMIRFEVAGPSSGAIVELAVFDLLGRKVKTLVNGPLEAGSYERVWDGTDESGREVSSGIYVARLKGKGFVGARKMVLTR